MVKKAETIVMKEEIESLKKCLKDKDKRIYKIEKRYKSIVTFVLVIWYVILVPGSYLLVGDAWCYIASNGSYDIFGYFGHCANHYNSINTTGADATYEATYEIPYALNGNAGFVLLIVMAILLVLLTLGWFTWFACYDEFHKGDD
jgi:hypothetical protein